MKSLANHIPPVKITESDGELAIEGELTFATVVDAYEKSKAYFSEPGTLVMNLAAVHKSDSASLALLLRWLRLAKMHKIQLSFSHMPKKMHDLGHVSGLDDILPIAQLF